MSVSHVIVSGLVVVFCMCVLFFFKQKTAYDMRISDWSSDVCSSDLPRLHQFFKDLADTQLGLLFVGTAPLCGGLDMIADVVGGQAQLSCWLVADEYFRRQTDVPDSAVLLFYQSRSEEHTSELQSLMRISYAVFCLKKKTFNQNKNKLKARTKLGK